MIEVKLSVFNKPLGESLAARGLLFTAVDTVSYTLCTMILIYNNMYSTATYFSCCVWPFSSSSYKVIKEVQKCALPHILNMVHNITGNCENNTLGLYTYIQSVPGGMCQTSGECSLS
jgi:hypothetical protein